MNINYTMEIYCVTVITIISNLFKEIKVSLLSGIPLNITLN